MPLHSYTKRIFSQLLLIGSICEKMQWKPKRDQKTSNTVKAIVSLVLVRTLKLVGLVLSICNVTFNIYLNKISLKKIDLLDRYSHNYQIQLTACEIKLVSLAFWKCDKMWHKDKRIRRYDITGGGTPIFSHQFCANLVSGPGGQSGV